MDGQKKNEKESWSRNRIAIVIMILFPFGISVAVGLLIGFFISIGKWETFFGHWLWSAAFLYCLAGGTPVGGLLMLIFRKWDDGFCAKVGNILWYGTTVGGVALSQLLKFDLSMGVFVAAFVISALACSILKDWGEHGEGKEVAKTSIIIVLSLVAVAYMLDIRWDNLDKISAAEKEQEAYDVAYDDGYQQGREDQEASDWEKLTIEGKSIVDIVDLVYDHYGMTPQEAWGVIEEYNYDGTHGGFTWEEYMDAMEAAVATAMYFPPME